MKMTIDIIMDRARVREKGPNQQIWQHLLSGTGGIDRSRPLVRLEFFRFTYLYAFVLKNIYSNYVEH